MFNLSSAAGRPIVRLEILGVTDTEQCAYSSGSLVIIRDPSLHRTSSDP